MVRILQSAPLESAPPSVIATTSRIPVLGSLLWPSSPSHHRHITLTNIIIINVPVASVARWRRPRQPPNQESANETADRGHSEIVVFRRDQLTFSPVSKWNSLQQDRKDIFRTECGPPTASICLFLKVLVHQTPKPLCPKFQWRHPEVDSSTVARLTEDKCMVKDP